MEYVIIIALCAWIIYLYTIISDLKKQIKPNSELIPPVKNELDYKQFQKERSNRPQETEFKKTAKSPAKSKNSGNPNYEMSQDELLKHMGNRIPSEYLKPKKEIEDTSSFFYKKKVCISGDFSAYPVRAELAKYLWELGADVDTQVGKTLDFLICGENAGPSKCAIAEKQKVRIIHEDELIELLPEFKSKYL